MPKIDRLNFSFDEDLQIQGSILEQENRLFSVFHHHVDSPRTPAVGDGRLILVQMWLMRQSITLLATQIHFGFGQ
jgi:hypothetical protein